MLNIKSYNFWVLLLFQMLPKVLSPKIPLFPFYHTRRRHTHHLQKQQQHPTTTWFFTCLRNSAKAAAEILEESLPSFLLPIHQSCGKVRDKDIYFQPRSSPSIFFLRVTQSEL